MSKLLWDKVEGTDQKNLLQTKCDLVGVQGNPLKLLGSRDVNPRIGSMVFPTRVLVAETITTDLILG